LTVVVRRSNHSTRFNPQSARSHPQSARSHPQSARSNPHSARSHPQSARFNPQSARSHPQSARSHPQSARSNPHSVRSHPQSARSHPQSARFHPQSARFHPQSARFHPQSARFHPQIDYISDSPFNCHSSLTAKPYPSKKLTIHRVQRVHEGGGRGGGGGMNYFTICRRCLVTAPPLPLLPPVQANCSFREFAEHFKSVFCVLALQFACIFIYVHVLYIGRSNICTM
jgi:hypothetical protein